MENNLNKNTEDKTIYLYIKNKKQKTSVKRNTPRTSPNDPAESWCLSPSHVSLHVKRQVIGPGEGALAQVALEGSMARVLPEVTR